MHIEADSEKITYLEIFSWILKPNECWIIIVTIVTIPTTSINLVKIIFITGLILMFFS